ncbi:MAG: transposase [Candidatus Rokubacteria bacterium]|nr:transposase [Candidatus Rokubacteria bacterium]
MFRRPDEGLLARRIAAWRRAYGERRPGPPPGLLCQDPGGGPQRDHPRRQRLLRPQGGRLAGGPAGLLRDRGPAHPAPQRRAGPPAVHRGQPRRGGRRVVLSAHARWPHPFRFVVIRRPQPEEPSEQLTLFKLGKYHYQVLVTNLTLQPLNLWRFYNGRAGVERIIRELKGDYPLGKIPTRHFFANEAYFHLLLCAYNLVNWFKRLCLPPDFQTATLQTLRNRILLMPAQLLRRGNRPRLAMPTSGPREAAWKYALHGIERLKP